MIPLDQMSPASISQSIPERPELQSLLGMRILIVDDEPSICSLLADILREQGAETSCTCEPSEALRLLNCASYDLVLSDLHMPGMDGFQLLEQINHLVPAPAVVMVTGCSELSIAVDAMRAGALNYITKPFNTKKVSDVVADSGRVVESRKQDLAREKKRLAEQLSEVNLLHSQLTDSSDQAIEALVVALDAREHETHNHSLRVAEYANCLAVALNLDEDRRRVLWRAAMLHDIGKIGVADEILNKEGKLSAQEWELLRKHPQIGYDILQRVHTLVPPSGIVLAHHEKFDGSGYPRGLQEEEIPLEARILTLADSLDAMTSDRPYRRALSFPDAAEEIRRVSGTQFDPLVVAAFHGISLENWAKLRARTLS